MPVPPLDTPERARDASHLERAASWLSLACAVHCLVMPAALALLPVLGATTFQLSEGVDHVLSALVIVSATAGAVWGYRRHHDVRFLIVTAIGLVCYLAGHALEPRWYGVVTAVLGALVLAASSFLGARLGHAAVHPHHADASCSH
ncbi:MAG TPA: MerC domain-containing protein [Polyangiales bacterium]|nr:MerC domain-containing protein [Polyangiales bacterium]